MDVAKQVVDQWVRNIANKNKELLVDGNGQSITNEEKRLSVAFLLLGFASYLDVELEEAVAYITDGGGDGGFDAAYMTEGDEQSLKVVLFQSKYTRNMDKDSNFPANAVKKAINAVRYIFNPQAVMHLNPLSSAFVDDIRESTSEGKIPPVTFVLINNGLKWQADAQTFIDNDFDEKKQDQVRFVHYSHLDILRYINSSNPINSSIRMTGKAINEDFNYKRVILGKVCVTEIASLMNNNTDALLDKNIRHYLGNNAVNSGIRDTLLDDKTRQNFFFYNNGITMICSKFAYNALREQDWIVNADGLQIINGRQTCKTIQRTLTENSGKDFSDAFVLIRLYELPSTEEGESIVHKITRATNSQNPVDLKDLRSNDDAQVLLEKSANELGWTYKRKRDSTAIAVNYIPSSVAAEAVLAVWRNSPHLARYRKNELFGAYYERIFKDLNGAQMVTAVVIYRYCDAARKRRTADYNSSAHRAFSAYFLANIIGKMLLKANGICNVDGITHKNFEVLMKYFEDNKTALYKKADDALVKMLQGYFGQDDIYLLDGRTMASAFRREDLLRRYVDNGKWWSDNIGAQ